MKIICSMRPSDLTNSAHKCFCILLLLVLSVVGHAQTTYPQVLQGGTATFAVVNNAPFGNQISQSTFYQILDPNGNQVASSFDFNPKWNVSYVTNDPKSSTGVTATVTAPSNATVGIKYILDIQIGNSDTGKDIATYFNVVAAQQQQNQSKQIGTVGDDSASAVTTDSHSNIIVAGETSGNLFGTSAGDDDIFLAKYDISGNLLWSKHFGTSSEDDVSQVIVDHNDNICIVGYTGGNLFGTSTRNGNAFVAQYDPNGNLLWSKQIGPNECLASSVTVDVQNNIYIVGATTGSLFSNNADSGDPTSYDGFLIKYNTNGSTVWSKQFGGPGDDIPSEVSLDQAGNPYIAGSTQQLFSTATGDTSSFLAKFDVHGVLVWGKQFGNNYKSNANSVYVDAYGNAYVAGYLSMFNGSINPEQPDTPDLPQYQDGYVAKFDTNGNLLWNRQLSSPDQDMPRTIRPDASGNLMIAGYTKGSLFGANSGDADIFLVKYSASGNQLSGSQIGNGSGSQTNDMCVSNNGFIYVVGKTAGNLFGSSFGGDDAFIARFNSATQIATKHPKSKMLTRPQTDILGLMNKHPMMPLNTLVSFVWAGKKAALSYPAMLFHSRPYMFIGYLRYGIPNSKLVYDREAKRAMIVSNTCNMITSINTRTYRVNGITQEMSTRPIIVNGLYYVPLDVVQSMLPFKVEYSASLKQVHFDPPKFTLLGSKIPLPYTKTFSMQPDSLYCKSAKTNGLHTVEYKAAQASIYSAGLKMVNGLKIGSRDSVD